MVLQRDSFTILGTNWRFKKAEVDIVAKKDESLNFIEVKTKRSKYFENPSNSIYKKKISLYTDVLEGYLEQYPSKLEVRFDVVNIIIGKDKTETEHIPNSF